MLIDKEFRLEPEQVLDALYHDVVSAESHHLMSKEQGKRKVAGLLAAKGHLLRSLHEKRRLERLCGANTRTATARHTVP